MNASQATGLSQAEPISVVSSLTGFDPSRETILTERLRNRLGAIEVEQFGGDNFAVFLCSAFEDIDDPEEEQDECGWGPSAIAGYEAVIRAVHAHYAPSIWLLQAELASAIEARSDATPKSDAAEGESAAPQEDAQ